ncbi:MAG TPA: cytochrome P450 [Thermoanaerobaculia bacterium]|jgi:cytochrome P450 PksS|nr:cytochrome P450 [Thermoanaerobaculia bacterium]
MAQIKLPDLASPRFKADPHPLYARLRAEAPVYRARAFFLPAWIVTRYDDVLVVLKDQRFSKDFTSRMPWIPQSIHALTRNLLSLDPPDHTRLRALVNKAFTPSVADRLHARIQSVCDELLDAAAAEGSIDLVGGFGLPVPLTIIGDLLGVPRQDRRPFAAWTKLIAAGGSGGVVDLLRGLTGMWLCGRYLRKLAERRRAEPEDDLVTALIRAEEAGDKLSEDELISMIGLLLLAGYETTVNLIAGGALALIEHSQQLEMLRDNSNLAESAIEELLRYTSPADFASPRIAREDVALAASRIPRGSLVLASIGSANRDESQFRDPNTLDIAREPNRHLAFGIGAHFCVGAALARLEGRIALTTLFRRFPRLRLAVPRESLRWRRSMLFRGLRQLPVVW